MGEVRKDARGIFVEVIAEVKAVGRCCCRCVCSYREGSGGLRLRILAGKGKGGRIAGGGDGIRRTNVEGYVESFTLWFVMGFFGAAAKEGRVVPLWVAL